MEALVTHKHLAKEGKCELPLEQRDETCESTACITWRDGKFWVCSRFIKWYVGAAIDTPSIKGDWDVYHCEGEHTIIAEYTEEFARAADGERMVTIACPFCRNLAHYNGSVNKLEELIRSSGRKQ